MKILYLGKFARFHSTENYVSHALQILGVDVVSASYQKGDAQYICQRIREEKADVVLFSKPEPRGAAEILQWCSYNHVLTVCWQWDIFQGYRHKRPTQFKSDLLFTTDGGHCKTFAEQGYNHRVLRQGIHEPDHVMYPEMYKHDVAFVGSPRIRGHPQREKLVRWLQRTYQGRFIHHTHVRGLDLNRALARVKVVVGDSYLSANYWSNRIYEITGRGGFFMHPTTPGLDEEFTPGKHYISYVRNDFRALRDSIDYWIDHNDEREQIRFQGFQHCGRHHTYTHRARDLLAKIEKMRT